MFILFRLLLRLTLYLFSSSCGFALHLHFFASYFVSFHCRARLTILALRLDSRSGAVKHCRNFKNHHSIGIICSEFVFLWCAWWVCFLMFGPGMRMPMWMWMMMWRWKQLMQNAFQLGLSSPCQDKWHATKCQLQQSTFRLRRNLKQLKTDCGNILGSSSGNFCWEVFSTCALGRAVSCRSEFGVDQQSNPFSMS